jgi:UDP-N-acetylglucosamine 4-epimerase
MDIYLVTGGAGFIGSHIVDELVRRGAQVRVLDNFFTGQRSNLSSFDLHPSNLSPSTLPPSDLHPSTLELIEGDIHNPDAVRQAMDGVDHVLHQAALPSVPRSVADPLTTNDFNVNGTLNVLLAAREAGVRRVEPGVCALSSSTYENSPVLPKRIVAVGGS